MKKRVLLIHNETSFREALSRQLKRHGYNVRCACHFQDALQCADFPQMDVLLINLDVPPAASRGFLSRLAELNPFVPFVDLSLVASAVDSRPGAIVEDPIGMGNLLRLIETLLTPRQEAPGGIRLAPLKAAALKGDQSRRPADPGICPAAYSGWGIND